MGGPDTAGRRRRRVRAAGHRRRPAHGQAPRDREESRRRRAVDGLAHVHQRCRSGGAPGAATAGRPGSRHRWRGVQRHRGRHLQRGAQLLSRGHRAHGVGQRDPRTGLAGRPAGLAERAARSFRRQLRARLVRPRRPVPDRPRLRRRVDQAGPRRRGPDRRLHRRRRLTRGQPHAQPGTGRRRQGLPRRPGCPRRRPHHPRPRRGGPVGTQRLAGEQGPNRRIELIVQGTV